MEEAAARWEDAGWEDGGQAGFAGEPRAAAIPAGIPVQNEGDYRRGYEDGYTSGLKYSKEALA